MVESQNGLPVDSMKGVLASAQADCWSTLTGMLGNILFLNLSAALTFRFCQAIASGNIPVITTYIADISDETNEARAFSYLLIQRRIFPSIVVVWVFNPRIRPIKPQDTVEEIIEPGTAFFVVWKHIFCYWTESITR